MYTDFRDQNGNPVSAETVLAAIKEPIIRHETLFEIFHKNQITPFTFVREGDYIRESLFISNSCGSDGIKLGSVNIGQAKFIIKNAKVATLQSPDTLIDTWFPLTYRLEVDENTTAVVMGGVYYVKELEQLAEGVKLIAYDGMCKLDAPFSGALSGTPYQILTAAATACGVRVQSTQAEIEALPNGTKTFTLHEDNDCKNWRDVLSYLTALMGCFVTFGRSTYGAMTLPGIVVRPFGGGASSFCDTITDSQRYTGAKFSLWDTAYAEFTLKAYALEDPNDPDSAKKQDFTYTDTTISTEGQTIDLGYNPFLQATTPETGLTQDQIAILHDLLEKVATYQYTPLQITLPVGFIYDLGDVIKCTGRLANTGFAGGAVDDAYGVILNETYTYGRDYRIKSLDSHAGKGRKIVTPQATVFGAEWDGSSTTLLTPTDGAVGFADPVPYVAGATSYSSPFDDIMPWSGIERVTDANAGELVKIPKFWYKTTFENGTYKFQIANVETEGFSVAPAFMDRGDGKGERDYVYIGRYHCGEVNFKSTSGVKPKVGDNSHSSVGTRAYFRTYIHNLGSDIWQMDYAMLITIQMLYLVEYANWDCQAVIGGGCSEDAGSSSTIFNNGGTDSMPYHTGTISGLHTAYGCCQYRYMENLWGNCQAWLDGVYFAGTDIYAIKNPANFSDTSGGTLVGTRLTSKGYISAFAKSDVDGFEWFYFPSATAGTAGQYVPDYFNLFGDPITVLSFGANFSQNPIFGLFFLYCTVSNSKGVGAGARLMYLP